MESDKSFETKSHDNFVKSLSSLIGEIIQILLFKKGFRGLKSDYSIFNLLAEHLEDDV
jgi:hypothetical protein